MSARPIHDHESAVQMRAWWLVLVSLAGALLIVAATST